MSRGPEIIIFRLEAHPHIASTWLATLGSPDEAARYGEVVGWVYPSGVAVSDVFQVLPQPPSMALAPEVAWGLLGVAYQAMAEDPRLTASLGALFEGPRCTLGFHPTATPAALTRHFASVFEPLDLERLVASRMAERAVFDDPDATARAWLGYHKPNPGLERVYDFLVGGAGPGRVGRVPKSLTGALRGEAPSRFDELLDRALWALVHHPSWMPSVEASLALSDGLVDQHALWRERLLKAGLDELGVEAVSAEALTLSRQGANSRKGWLLDRAARDPEAFVDRHFGRGYAPALFAQLFVAAAGELNLPRLGGVAEAMLGLRRAEPSIESFEQLARGPRGLGFLRAHEGAVRKLCGYLNPARVDALFG